MAARRKYSKTFESALRQPQETNHAQQPGACRRSRGASSDKSWYPVFGQGVSTMMKKTRAAAIAALGLGVALAASACAGGASSGNSGGGSSSGGNVTLTFWTNATPGPGLTFFQNAIKSFDAAHPGVTIKMQNIQNED